MPKPHEIVLAFQEAIGHKDFAAARKLMQDNLEFRGPIDTFHKADDYLHAIQKLSAIVEGVDILKVFEDGNDVSLFCDLKTKPVGTRSMKAKSHLCASSSTRGLLRQCSPKGRDRNWQEMSPLDVFACFF